MLLSLTRIDNAGRVVACGTCIVDGSDKEQPAQYSNQTQVRGKSPIYSDLPKGDPCIQNTMLTADKQMFPSQSCLTQDHVVDRKRPY